MRNVTANYSFYKKVLVICGVSIWSLFARSTLLASQECSRIIKSLPRMFLLHIPASHKVYGGIEIAVKTSRGRRFVPPLDNFRSANTAAFRASELGYRDPVQDLSTLRDLLRISYSSPRDLAIKLADVFEVYRDKKERRDVLALESPENSFARFRRFDSIYFDSADRRLAPKGGNKYASVRWLQEFDGSDFGTMSMPARSSAILETPWQGGVSLGTRDVPPTPDSFPVGTKDPVYFFWTNLWQIDLLRQEGGADPFKVSRELYASGAQNISLFPQSANKSPQRFNPPVLFTDIELIPSLRIFTHRLSMDLVYYDFGGGRHIVGQVNFDQSLSSDISSRGRIPVNHTEIKIKLDPLLETSELAVSLAPFEFMQTLNNLLPTYTRSSGEQQSKFDTAHRLLSNEYLKMDPEEGDEPDLRVE